jgi:hypothetical protein
MQGPVAAEHALAACLAQRSLWKTVSSSDFRPNEGENLNGSPISAGSVACDHGPGAGGACDADLNPPPAQAATYYGLRADKSGKSGH